MKKMKSWYMGPVRGATSESQGWPVTAARTTENARNEATYVSVIWKRPRAWMITEPKAQTTTMGRRLLPHCTESPATVSEASTSMATTPRFEGFQRWRPSTRITYFDVIEI